ncbi:hypothetical protein [Bdellovibrio bacteriovorus]|uniref:hypothetical protein n=1 Tax=Bdellovibrio bacteriovorus TaxID=959 RepID=UPI0035A6BD8E
MKKCESCGNEYEDVFEVKFQNGTSHWFDSFECAAHKLAPTCLHCGVKILGHGVQVEEKIYCCASCSRHAGFKGVVDHAGKQQVQRQ